MSKEIVLKGIDVEIWLMYKDDMRQQYERYKSKLKFDKLLIEKHDELEKYVGKDYWHQGKYGWECETSPIGFCVYPANAVELYGDECCYYCGEPEERK